MLQQMIPLELLLPELISSIFYPWSLPWGRRECLCFQCSVLPQHFWEDRHEIHVISDFLISTEYSPSSQAKRPPLSTEFQEFPRKIWIRFKFKVSVAFKK